MSKKPIKQDDEWGNIELPGLSDEELYSKDWNKVAANLERYSNPEYKKRHQESIQKSWQDKQTRNNRLKFWQDEEFKLKIKQQRKEIGNRPEIKEMRKNKMLELHQDPTFKKNYQKGREKLKNGPVSDKVIQANQIEGAKRRKPIQTPFGKFDGLTIAAKALEIAVGTLQTRMKNYPDQYYYIDKNG